VGPPAVTKEARTILSSLGVEPASPTRRAPRLSRS
jgi:hypothetical protein